MKNTKHEATTDSDGFAETDFHNHGSAVTRPNDLGCVMFTTGSPRVSASAHCLVALATCDFACNTNANICYVWRCVVYQYFLNAGLSDFILNDTRRDNFLSANKEGLCSSLGKSPCIITVRTPPEGRECVCGWAGGA